MKTKIIELSDYERARQREANRASYYRNRDKRLATIAKYRTENKDKVAACISKWREANREKVRSQNSEWKAANQVKVKADNASWRKVNKEKTRAHWHAYRARKIASGGTVSDGLFERLMYAQKGRCVNCLSLLKHTSAHMDHVYPLAKGGIHDDKNIQLLCPTCNRRKGSKDPIEFAQQNGRLL